MTLRAATSTQGDPSVSLESGKLPESASSTSTLTASCTRLSPMAPSSSLSAVHAAKGVLRKQMRQRLASLDDATLTAQSAAAPSCTDRRSLTLIYV